MASAFVYVGVDEADAPYRSHDSFALLRDKPGKDTKAKLKAQLPSKAKLSFHDRCARLTLPKHQLNEDAIVAYWSQAHTLAPTVFVLREVRGYHRTRSDAHRAALGVAEASLGVFTDALAGQRNSITRQLGLLVVDELAIADLGRSFDPPVAEHADAALRQRHLDRVRWMGMGLVNEPSTAVELIEELTWDARDAIAMLGEVAERVASWGERLDAEREEVALQLARRLAAWGFERPSGGPDRAYRRHVFANALLVALKAAMQAKDAKLTKTFRAAVEACGTDVSPNLALADQRRYADDPRFNRLMESTLAPNAETLLKVAHWVASRDAAIALELYERLAKLPDPHWHVANNGVAMLLTVHPGKVPKAAITRWRKRIEACHEAPARHNLACLLARVGELDDAKAALLEAIGGDADLGPIVSDEELRGLLDDADVVVALKAAAKRQGESWRQLNALRKQAVAGAAG